MKQVAKNRAKLEILHWICEFSLPVKYGSSGVSAYTCFSDNMHPAVGSLVAIQSSPVSKFYLSWVEAVEDRDGWTHYLLESIEDGTLGWWSNVGILAYDSEVVGKHPEWRWTDAQFKFADKWKHACYKERDAYITLPTGPTFHGDGSVTIGTRTRHGFDDHAPQKTFPNWRKVTTGMLLRFYDAAVESRPKKPSEKAAQAEQSTTRLPHGSDSDAGK